MTTTPERTPAERLRAAAARLRCRHTFSIQPPAGSLAFPGPCEKCGVAYDNQPHVSDYLREPLAKWLEDVAEGITGRDPEYGCYCIVEDSYHRALAVARVINGGAS